jgi:hypothetical protein
MTGGLGGTGWWPLPGAGTMAAMSKPRSAGVCKLTGEFGKFVDSHIIPLALTRLSETGEKYVEAGIGLGLKRRANSWYDGGLVTMAGEDILAAIDSKGIDELRKYRLVWSGWTPEKGLDTDDLVTHGESSAFRVVRIARPELLQMFFLSLLWRAGATARTEFKEVVLAEDVLEDLRRRVVKREPGAFGDYPVQLFQLVTRGVRHNRVPLLERKRALNLDGSLGPEVSYVRFYFDGLVAHVHLGRGVPLSLEYLNSCLGFLEDTTVFAHEFGQSRTAENIREMVEVVQRERMTIETPHSPIAAAVRSAWPPKPRQG